MHHILYGILYIPYNIYVITYINMLLKAPYVIFMSTKKNLHLVLTDNNI